MTVAFHGIPMEVKKVSARMVNEASTNLLHGMGNILDTYSFHAEANIEGLTFGNINETKREKVGSMCFKSLNLTEAKTLQAEERWTWIRKESCCINRSHQVDHGHHVQEVITEA